MILIYILFFIVISFKIIFWLYLLQLKEYRFDRIKEYLLTPQWKKAIFNPIFFLELIFLIITMAFYIVNNYSNNLLYSEIINIIFTILIFLEAIFYIYKLIKKKIFYPKNTKRLLITTTITYLIIWFILLLTNNQSFLIIVLFTLIIFPFLLVFLANTIFSPVAYIMKKRKYNQARDKLKKYKNLKIIWITWSYGKTSIKEFLYTLLSQKYKTIKTPDFVNSELWISDFILKTDFSDYEYFVSEMWAYSSWEIRTIWEIVWHKDAFISAIWNQHIWLFWWQEKLLNAKLEIKEKVLENSGKLYLNFNNEFLSNYKYEKNLDIFKYWNKLENLDSKYIYKKEKNKLEILYKKEKYSFDLSIKWEHNMLNLAWIIWYCLENWLNKQEIQTWIKAIKIPKWAKDIQNYKIWDINLKIIDDTHNLSFHSIKSSLDMIKDEKAEKILVLDDILELWKDSEEIHIELWKIINKSKIDKVISLWINYKKYIIKWLLKKWFKKENIISEIKDIEKDTIILFQWKKSKTILNKLKKSFDL